jgi:hypothetical protein
MDDDESSKKAEDVRFSSAAAEKTDGTKKTLDWLHNHIWLLALFWDFVFSLRSVSLL